MKYARQAEPNEGPARGQSQTVLWVIAVLLAVIATALVLRLDEPAGRGMAFGQVPRAGARGIYAFAGQLSRSSYGVFMLDVDAGTIWCYEYKPATQRLKLVAARSWFYDRYLEEYNVDDPTPAQVEELVRKQRARALQLEGEAATGPGGSAAPEASPSGQAVSTAGG